MSGSEKQDVAMSHREQQDPEPVNDRHDGDRSRSPSRERSRSRSRSRTRSPERRAASRSPSRSRSRSKSRSRSRRRSRSKSRDRRRRSRSRSRDRRRRTRSRSRSARRSPIRRGRKEVADRDAPEATHVLGVFGLSLYTKEKELLYEFERYGPVDKMSLIYDQRTGRSRGFGFCYFRKVSDASRAKDAMNGMELHGRKIRVDYSVTRRAHTPTPGRYMGRPDDRYSDRGRRYSRSRSRTRSRSRRRSYSP